ncbi:PP2C family protein-serine/threonine phosphatase [Streptomyces sp. NPDC007084]|uniref:PP2C family protein-serine/threonine phosphatase n=1 Tax=Streptomyces sp. NPDC007084 TaxID=3154313 RepID=UPI0034525544
MAARRSLLDQLPRAGRRDAVQRQKPLLVRGHSVAWMPPMLLLIGIALLDANTSGRFRIISWVALVPAIAAAICGVAGTTALAVLSLLTYIVMDSSWPHQYQTGLPDFILVLAGGLLAVLACLVRTRGERRMLHMQDVAETTRRTVLRPMAPGWGGLDHAAVYLAADSEARVGGDFYDIQPGLHGTRLLLGDVQGKGLGAVEAAAALLGTFREAAYHEPLLETVAGRLEVRMIRHVVYCAALGRDEGDRFATGVLVAFPEDTPDTVEVVNFGHEPPLVIGPKGVRNLPPGNGLPLGLSELTAEPPSVLRVPLAPGETLLLVTDGVTEARDTAGAFFPLREAVTEAVARDPAAADPDLLVHLIRDATLRHSAGRLADDTTIFAVRRRSRGYAADLDDVT